MKTLPLALLGLALTAGVPAQTTQSSPPTPQQMGSRKHYVGLSNFGEVTPTLFRGGQPGVDGLKALKKMGVSIIVDMRSGTSTHEKVVVHKLGMQYVSIPWHCPFPHDEPFAQFLKIIQDNPGKKIFVHCRLGDDRTGMAIASYRMALQGWTADQAMKEMEFFGFTGVHHVICPALASYERHFPDHLRTSKAFKDLQLTAK